MRGVSIIGSMVIDMNEAQMRTLEQVRQVLAGTQALEFRRAEDDQGRYGWIEHAFARRYTAADVALLAEVDRATAPAAAGATRCGAGSPPPRSMRTSPTTMRRP